MPTSKTIEEQIFIALRQADAGMPVAEICHRLGMSKASFYRWRKVYAGLGLPEIRLVMKLSDENKKLKRLLAFVKREQTKHQDWLERLAASRGQATNPLLSDCDARFPLRVSASASAPTASLRHTSSAADSTSHG